MFAALAKNFLSTKNTKDKTANPMRLVRKIIFWDISLMSSYFVFGLFAFFVPFVDSICFLFFVRSRHAIFRHRF